jgi:hypothetical protein
MLGAQLVMGWAEDRAQSVANVKKTFCSVIYTTIGVISAQSKTDDNLGPNNILVGIYSQI